MKRLALATLLSSLLVAAISLAEYFMWREMDMDLSSPTVFWLSALLGSTFLLVLALVPAAAAPPTLLKSTACVALASAIGTTAAVAFVVLRIWGTLARLDDGGPEILFELKNLVLPATVALAIGALWRYVRNLKSRSSVVGV